MKIGTLSFLGIVFVTLKLCHVIDWSWWWVTAPFWGGVCLWLVAVIVASLAEVSRKPEEPKETRWTKRLRELQEEQQSRRK